MRQHLWGDVPGNQIATLRAEGLGWKQIASKMGVGVGTLYRVIASGSNNGEMEL